MTTYDYGTSEAESSASPEDLMPGGAYNRDEATCINTRITSQRIALIQTEASTLQEALAQAIEQCQKWSSQ